jgi:hypothetical protein
MRGAFNVSSARDSREENTAKQKERGHKLP